MSPAATAYSVHAEAQAPQGAGPLREAESVTDDLMDLLAAHSGVCGADERSWSVTLAVDADDAPQACARGSALILGLAVKAGLPDWPLVHIEAVRGDVLDAEHARPYIPPLASGPAAAEILGVCRQRVYQLADHPDFPEPLYELGAGKLWHRTATERFTAEWERRPGRPPHIRPESMGE